MTFLSKELHLNITTAHTNMCLWVGYRFECLPEKNRRLIFQFSHLRNKFPFDIKNEAVL